jgi:DNA polymerase V
VDGLNRDYGRGTLGYAAAGKQQAWKLRRDMLSPRYTTEWNELLSV